jgi:hypothetical protein
MNYMGERKKKRLEQRAKRQRKQKMKLVTYLIFGIGILGVLIYTVTFGARPAVGEEVEVMADVSHVAEGTDPGPYNTNPPTSGRHYASQYFPGFYEEEDVDVPYPAGYLVHSLEHGYVIFWYNCDTLNEAECDDLKTDIRSVMDRADNHKVIAYPWPSLDIPITMTSWGRMLRFDDGFDPELAFEFVLNNRNKAPEPHAP